MVFLGGPLGVCPPPAPWSGVRAPQRGRRPQSSAPAPVLMVGRERRAGPAWRGSQGFGNGATACSCVGKERRGGCPRGPLRAGGAGAVSGGEASGCCPSASSSGHVPSVPGRPFSGCKSQLCTTGSVPDSCWDPRGGCSRDSVPGQRGAGGLGPQALLQRRRFLALGEPPAPSLPSGVGPKSCTWPCRAPRQPAPGSAGWGWSNSVPRSTLLFLRGRWLAGKDTASRARCGSAGSPGRVSCAAPWWWGRALGMLSSRFGFAGGAVPGSNPAAPRVWGRSLAPLSLRSKPPGGRILCRPSLRLGEMLWLPSSPVGTLSPSPHTLTPSPRAPHSSQGGSRGPEGARACIWAPRGLWALFSSLAMKGPIHPRQQGSNSPPG